MADRVSGGVVVAGVLASGFLLFGCAQNEAPAGESAGPVSAPAVSEAFSEPGPASSSAGQEQDGAAASRRVEDETEYRPIPIEQSVYKGEYATLTIEELPTTEAQVLVCDEYYSWVMGEGDTVAALWLPPQDGEYYPVRDDIEQVTVHPVRKMSREEMVREDAGRNTRCCPFFGKN